MSGRHTFQRALRGCALVIVMVIAGLVSASTARADDYESALLDGVTVRDRALQTNDREDWRRALAHLDRAVSRRVTAEALFERAGIFAALGESASATNDYESAIALGLPRPAEEHAAGYVATHETTLGRLWIGGPHGATVVLTGCRPVRLPLVRDVAVPAGKLDVRVEAPGYQPWRATLAMAAGRREVRAVRLKRAVPARQAAPARVSDGVSSSWSRGARVAGAGLAAAGGVTALVTSLVLPAARRDLEARCLTLSSDGCERALYAERGAAQAAADRIETLEAARWLGAGTLLIGAVSFGLGVLLSSASASAAEDVTVVWVPHVSDGELGSIIALKRPL